MDFDEDWEFPEVGALQFRTRKNDREMFADLWETRGDMVAPGRVFAGVEPPVWMAETEAGMALLDAAPRLRMIDVVSRHEVWGVEIAGHPRDLQVSRAGPIILLETFPEMSQVTLFDPFTGNVDAQVTLPNVLAGWLACLVDGQFAVTDAASGDLLVFDAHGQAVKELTVGPGVRGVWSQGGVCVVSWPAGNRLVIIEVADWSVRTIDVPDLELVVGAVISPAGDWLLLTRLQQYPPLQVDLSSCEAREVRTDMPSTRFSPILLSPDGKTLAGMINRGVILLHLANHRLRHLQQLADADGFAFTRDGGAYLFTAGRIAAASLH